jgi:hypothetical protein
MLSLCSPLLSVEPIDCCHCIVCELDPFRGHHTLLLGNFLHSVIIMFRHVRWAWHCHYLIWGPDVMYDIIIIIFLSSIRPLVTCYGNYKTESLHLFRGLPKFLFPFGWYFRIIFGILQLILSTCSFQFFLYWYMNSVICEICNSVKMS